MHTQALTDCLRVCILATHLKQRLDNLRAVGKRVHKDVELAAVGSSLCCHLGYGKARVAGVALVGGNLRASAGILACMGTRGWIDVTCAEILFAIQHACTHACAHVPGYVCCSLVSVFFIPWVCCAIPWVCCAISVPYCGAQVEIVATCWRTCNE